MCHSIKERSENYLEMQKKWWVLAQSPYSQQGNQGGNHGDRPPVAEDAQGADTFKGWEHKRDCWCIPDTFM